jgi:hypothetical protein
MHKRNKYCESGRRTGQHNNRSGGVETLVSQQYGKAADIKNQSANQNAIAGETLRANCRMLHLYWFDSKQSARGFKRRNFVE